MLAGVHLGIAYQIVPLHDRDNCWCWTFYPRIGDGESHSADCSGESAAAERACMHAIREFVNETAQERREAHFDRA